MLEMLEYIVKNLVENKDNVHIEMIEQGKTKVFKVKVDKKDIGNVIGHGGIVAKSIRTVVSSMRAERERVVIKFDENE